MICLLRAVPRGAVFFVGGDPLPPVTRNDTFCARPKNAEKVCKSPPKQTRFQHYSKKCSIKCANHPQNRHFFSNREKTEVFSRFPLHPSRPHPQNRHFFSNREKTEISSAFSSVYYRRHGAPGQSAPPPRTPKMNVFPQKENTLTL